MTDRRTQTPVRGAAVRGVETPRSGSKAPSELSTGRIRPQSPRDFLASAQGFNPGSTGHASTVPAQTVPPTFAVVVPCLNEEAAIGDLVHEVLAAATRPDLPATLQAVYVVDNGSSDRTAAVARAAGATVVAEPRRGYGRACLSGVIAAEGADLIVLMDGDRSDNPAELPSLLAPLLAGAADLVVGSRTRGAYEPGSLQLQQRVGNWIAARLLRLLYGVRVTDIGPFRVVRRDDLLQIGMRELTYGWSVEMLARGARAGLRIHEIPVTYRKRAGGESKVSGNLRASVRAGYRIVVTILRARR